MLSVLVVDDDPSVLEVTRLMLERADDITVKPAGSSREALEALAKERFDTIVLDYDLPEINGIDFLKIIRRRGDVTPVIIFTGVGREQAAISALNCGATFFLKKGEGTDRPFVELDRMIRQAVDQRFTGNTKNLPTRIVSDLIGFSLDAGFAIDPRGTVIAWNAAMEQLTGVPAQTVMDKGDFVYSVSLFGIRQKMLIDLVFSSDDAIKESRYMIVSREKNGPVVGVTRAGKANGKEWTLWIKAMPLFDNRGEFIAAVCIVRDVTTTFRDVSIDDEKPAKTDPPEEGTGEKESPASGRIIDWILGRAGVQYREGVHLYVQKSQYREAIQAFDRALEIDKNLAYVWNDRGICYRTLGNFDEALTSIVRAAELDPGNVEILYDLGETLEQMGVMQMNKTYLESAIETFRMVLNILPNNMDSWYQIGVCLRELGKTDESRFYADRARDIGLLNKDMPISRKREIFL